MRNMRLQEVDRMLGSLEAWGILRRGEYYRLNMKLEDWGILICKRKAIVSRMNDLFKRPNIGFVFGDRRTNDK